MNSSHFQNHVLRVVQKDRESGKIIGTDDDDGPFPVGTITYNYLDPVGFHPLRVDTFDSKTSLTKVTVADNSENDQVYHLTCSQVDNLVRGNLKSETIKQLVGRCFVVQSSTNEPKIAQLVSATYGRAEVHWLDRVNVGSASRPRSSARRCAGSRAGYAQRPAPAHPQTGTLSPRTPWPSAPSPTQGGD